MYSNMVEETGEAAGFDLMDGLAEAWASIPANLAGLVETVADPLGLNVGTTNDMAEAAEEQGVHMSTYSVMRNQFGSQAAAFSYLLFILLYVPCVAAMGAVNREAGRKWMWMVGFWSTYMAYTVSTAYYQIATFSHHPGSSTGWLVMLASAFAFVLFLLYRAGRKKEFAASAMNPMRAANAE